VPKARRALQLAPGPAACDSDAGSSSGDDATRRAVASLFAAQRLCRGGAVLSSRLAPAGGGMAGAGDARGRRAASQSRWAGRLVILAGIKMVHSLLSAKR
jgi:hypothetical protein